MGVSEEAAATAPDGEPEHLGSENPATETTTKFDESPSDVIEQLEQVEAAVSAALDESGEEEAVADKPTATDETSEPDAATESLQAVAESLESGEESTAVDQAKSSAEKAAAQDSPPQSPDRTAIGTDDPEPVGEPATGGPVDETPAPAPGKPDAAANQPAASPKDHPTSKAEPDAPKSNAPDTLTDPKLTDPKPSTKDRLKAGVVAIALPVGRVIMTKTGDLLARGTEPLAFHLVDQPKVMRQSLAWLALWTAFNAGAVWSYLLFFRAPVAEVNPAAMTHISGAESAQTGGIDGNTGREAQGLDPATTLLLNPMQK